ncbi:MAG: hypothetical protein JO076_11625 [Verrucomicrobia bacterium]|nr:hypothetical protein [Verrucomicrobiota bacterium]
MNKFITFFIWAVMSGTGVSLAQQGTKPASHSRASAHTANTAKSPKAKKDTAAGRTDYFGGDDENRPKGPTEITARDQAQFDISNRTAVFMGSVKVVDPQFTMTSDKLTVHLNRDENGGGLNEADAEGNVFIVHMNQPKPGTAQAEPAAAGQNVPAQAQAPVRSTGKAEKAVYITKDGSVTLTGWPQVTQGANTHVAIEPNVKMILYKDGRMTTYGNTRTIIQDRGESAQKPTNVSR